MTCDFKFLDACAACLKVSRMQGYQMQAVQFGRKSQARPMVHHMRICACAYLPSTGSEMNDGCAASWI